MKEKPNWDGSTPVYSLEGDYYFNSIEEILESFNQMQDDGDEIEIHELPPEYLARLKLYHARPASPPMLSTDYLYEDLLDDFPVIEEEANKVIDRANKAIARIYKRHGILEDTGVRAIYGTGDEGGES